MDINIIFFIILIIAAWISIPHWPEKQPNRKPSNLRAVQGYNIRRKCDGYPLTLSIEDAYDAMQTGEYDWEGIHIPEGPAAGGYFTNDEHGQELWVPPGYILIKEEYEQNIDQEQL